MLKEEVILMCNTSNPSEDTTFHEIIGVGAKSINNLFVHLVGPFDGYTTKLCVMKAVTYIVIIPQVQLRNLSISAGEGLC
jgi:hypothetical protein